MTEEVPHLSPNRRILKLHDIIEHFAMSRSSVYRAMEREGFPKPMRLSSRSIGWWREEVERWFVDRERLIAPCADNAQYQTAEYLTSRPGMKDGQ